MTRTQKSKLYFVLINLFLIGTDFYYFWFYPEMHANDDTAAGAFLNPYFLVDIIISILFFIFIIIGSTRKQPVILTEAESKAPVAPHAEFHNHYPWEMAVWIFIVLLFLFGAQHAGSIRESVLEHGYEWGEAASIYFHRINSFGIWALSIFGCVFFLIPLFLPMRNKYVINGDMLFVYEYDFHKKETELQIPVAAIEKVWVMNIISFTPSVVVLIDGVERKLACASRPYDLAVALQQRINAKPLRKEEKNA